MTPQLSQVMRAAHNALTLGLDSAVSPRWRSLAHVRRNPRAQAHLRAFLQRRPAAPLCPPSPQNWCTRAAEWQPVASQLTRHLPSHPAAFPRVSERFGWQRCKERARRRGRTGPQNATLALPPHSAAQVSEHFHSARFNKPSLPILAPWRLGVNPPSLARPKKSSLSTNRERRERR